MCIACDTRAAGRRAFLEGKSISVCPFAFINPFSQVWLDGYLQEEGDAVVAARALEFQTRREAA